MPDHSVLSTIFRHFGDVEVKDESPLYEALCHIVANDESLLDLASFTASGQPPPNLFLGATHYVLAANPDDPLARYYRSFGGEQQPDDTLAPTFRTFCDQHRDELIRLLQVRIVQTNEVGRSACILPAASLASREAGGAPLAVIEVGPSAGLNLNFDRYHYDYGNGLEAGPPGSLCRITCDARGTLGPSDIATPEIASQIGFDRNPLDVGDERDVRWLRALVWPEHDDRRQLLEAAVKIAQRDPPLLLGTDLFRALPTVLALVPSAAVPLVVATFVLHQFAPEMRRRFRSLLQEAGYRRPVYMVLFGFGEFATGVRARAGIAFDLHLLRFNASGAQTRLLASAHPHGRWLEFRRESPWADLPQE